MVGRGEIAGGQSGEEIFKIGKKEPSAISVVKESIHEGAAELITEFPIVAAGVIRGVAEIMPIGVHSPARKRSIGAQSCLAGDVDLGQTEITVLDRIQANGARVEGSVLRGECFEETIVTPTQFEEQARSEDMGVGERDELHAGGCDGVETGKVAADDERERIALATIAKIIAAGEDIAGREVLVDFGEHAVEPV